MYRTTESSCECEYENAPKPSCHLNRPRSQLCSLMNLDEFALMSLTRSERAISGFSPTVWHAVDFDQLLPIVAYNAGDVLSNFFFVLSVDQTLSPLNFEDNLNVDLCIRIGHGTFHSYGVATLKVAAFYKHPIPTGFPTRAGRRKLCLPFGRILFNTQTSTSRTPNTKS